MLHRLQACRLAVKKQVGLGDSKYILAPVTVNIGNFYRVWVGRRGIRSGKEQGTIRLLGKDRELGIDWVSSITPVGDHNIGASIRRDITDGHPLAQKGAFQVIRNCACEGTGYGLVVDR